MALQSQRVSGGGYHPCCKEREREGLIPSSCETVCVRVCLCECVCVTMTHLLGPLNAPDRAGCIFCKRGLVRAKAAQPKSHMEHIVFRLSLSSPCFCQSQNYYLLKLIQ